MKIDLIEYENFRNFRDKGVIKFNTDGKLNVVYGVNGVGKTTLHQFFQWILKRELHFNKTTSNTIYYNMPFYNSLEENAHFNVKGKMEFEHQKIHYSITREIQYEKHNNKPVQICDNFNLMKSVNNNWENVQNPKKMLDEILPEGLSQYFFFDGETMVADLRIKSNDSKNKIKGALYKILDLNIIEKAIDLLGNENIKYSAIGNLKLQGINQIPDERVEQLKDMYKKMLETIDAANNKIHALDENIDKQDEIIKNATDKIGEVQATKIYEERINDKNDNIKEIEESIKNTYRDYGRTLSKGLMYILIYNKAKEVQKVIEEERTGNEITKINGISKPLIDSLLKSKRCICGNDISDKEIECLKSLYKYLPPQGYDVLCSQFLNQLKVMSEQLDPDTLNEYLHRVLNYDEKISTIQEEIKDLKARIIEAAPLQEVIIERDKAENTKKQLNDELLNTKINKHDNEKKIDGIRKKLDEASQNNEGLKLLNQKLEILENIKKYYSDLLEEKSIELSNKLQSEMQELLDCIMSEKRNVEVQQDFQLRVYDDTNDESKSEGQFASVSFAYIGAILKLLQKENLIDNKEFPLVLDAPFSKLSPDNLERVVKILPDFAPQMIIFSKDDLNNLIDRKKIGFTYKIVSNENKNISKVEEIK